MDNFTQAELKGREIYKQFITQFDGVDNYFETPGQYDVYDAGYTYKEKAYIVEIKYRNYNHNHFKTWILEQKKAKALHEISNGENIQYVNIFKDGVLLVWSLSKIGDITVQKEMHAKTTAELGIKIEKEVYHLPTNIAKKFQYA